MYVLVHSSHISIQNPQSWGGVLELRLFPCFTDDITAFLFPLRFSCSGKYFQETLREGSRVEYITPSSLPRSLPGTEVFEEGELKVSWNFTG